MSLRPIQIAMIALCVLMAGLFVYELSAAPSEYTLPEIHLKPRAIAAQAPPSFLPLPQTAFDAINDRPLFLPTRKPIAAPATPGTAVASGPPPLPPIALIGVLLDGQNSVAEIKVNGAAFAQAMHVGDNLSGWQIATVAPDHISLRSGTFSQDIRMDAKAGAPPAPGAPATPGAPPPPNTPPGAAQ